MSRTSRTLLAHRLKDAKNPEELADTLVEIMERMDNAEAKNKQLMDGLLEFLTNHRNENYIREIYNYHKSST